MCGGNTLAKKKSRRSVVSHDPGTEGLSAHVRAKNPYPAITLMAPLVYSDDGSSDVCAFAGGEPRSPWPTFHYSGLDLPYIDYGCAKKKKKRK
jgi:hypothetical protein